MTGKTIYRDTVKAEWTDYNGHLRDAFYMLIYSLATDAFMDSIGLDNAGRQARKRSLFTLEAHINFLREVKEGAAVRVDATIIGIDKKRIHLYMEMFDEHADAPVSAFEQMLLHVDTSSTPKSASFDADVMTKLESLIETATDKPAYAGRVIGLPASSRDASKGPA